MENYFTLCNTFLCFWPIKSLDVLIIGRNCDHRWLSHTKITLFAKFQCPISLPSLVIELNLDILTPGGHYDVIVWVKMLKIGQNHHHGWIFHTKISRDAKLQLHFSLPSIVIELGHFWPLGITMTPQWGQNIENWSKSSLWMNFSYQH